MTNSLLPMGDWSELLISFPLEQEWKHDNREEGIEKSGKKDMKTLLH